MIVMKNIILIMYCLVSALFAQLPVGYDTLKVIENNQVLYSSTCGGLNHSNVFKADINGDGKEDIIVLG